MLRTYCQNFEIVDICSHSQVLKQPFSRLRRLRGELIALYIRRFRVRVKDPDCHLTSLTKIKYVANLNHASSRKEVCRVYRPHSRWH